MNRLVATNHAYRGIAEIPHHAYVNHAFVDGETAVEIVVDDVIRKGMANIWFQLDADSPEVSIKLWVQPPIF